MAPNLKVSIIVPVYNERQTIQEILRRVTSVKLDLEKEIIVVDDASTDGTAAILNELPREMYTVVLKQKNEGKGAAIKTGLAYAQGNFVIFQDGDLEYDPADYPSLLKPLLTQQTDMVIGSRVLSGAMQLWGPQRAHWTSYLGCKIIAFAINILYGRHGTDYYGCYKAFRREVLQSVSVRANRFEYDSELLCKLLKRGVTAQEVPIAYHPRRYGEGKKLSFWRDGFAVLFSIIKWRFRAS
jgi:glycosyltransferase involved in cell wall biosynthesis